MPALQENDVVMSGEIGGCDALRRGRRLKPTLLKERNPGVAKQVERERGLGWAQAGMPVLATCGCGGACGCRFWGVG